MSHNYLDWAKYQSRHSWKSIWVTKLVFCQNDSPIVGHFGKRTAWSLIYFLNYACFDIQPSPNNYGTPSTRVFTRKPGGKRQAKEDLLEMMTAISPDPLCIKDTKILGWTTSYNILRATAVRFRYSRLQNKHRGSGVIFTFDHSWLFGLTTKSLEYARLSHHCTAGLPQNPGD